MGDVLPHLYWCFSLYIDFDVDLMSHSKARCKHHQNSLEILLHVSSKNKGILLQNHIVIITSKSFKMITSVVRTYISLDVLCSSWKVFS